MQPVRTARRRQRPRRGSSDRPLDPRLVRTTSLLLLVPLVLLLLTVTRAGPLPGPTLPPSFDGGSALELTRELTRNHPRRVPGSPGADSAAGWFADRLALYGIAVEEDTWKAEVPGLGQVTLRNVMGVVPGTLDQAIVLVAHRDNREGTSGANDNASGTAALVELARAYAAVGTGGARPRRPLHTLIFLSSDGGAYGGAGAARFARSELGRTTAVALVLDGLGGPTRPRLDVAGLDRRSPAPAIVRTLRARLADERVNALQPGALQQLVALATPLALGEQGPLLAAGIGAVRLTTAPVTAPPPGTDELESLDPAALARLGRAVEGTVTSLDGAVELPAATGGSVFVGGRAVRGWALECVLLTALLPFGAAALDLLARCRRRGTRLTGAWLAYRRRAGFWLLGLVALGVAAAAGALPLSTALPPRPDLPPTDRWNIVAIGAFVAAGVLTWLLARTLLVPRAQPDPEDELAGWATALVALLAVAVLLALASPYALLFVLPSLYAWLALVQIGRGRAWLADVLYAVGLLGPIVALVVLTRGLDLGASGPAYLAALVTSGTVPWLVSIALAGWLAVAAQIGALVAGRYAPIASASSRR